MFATGKAEEEIAAEDRFKNQSVVFCVSGAREGRGYDTQENGKQVQPRV